MITSLSDCIITSCKVRGALLHQSTKLKKTSLLCGKHTTILQIHVCIHLIVLLLMPSLNGRMTSSFLVVLIQVQVLLNCKEADRQNREVFI